ncbi:RNA-binding cell elongation regulator Jag/EloR [uncultured Limosilactobacillus sp.]|uniref:RNA-binding cell elongation regulator Jag/EloR n=1 Tax=uncultured Limosilactobacillus sp. TaxID=2837629 RepID=UPI002600D76D|nr:RNA-binding cell elongation regulator Jag/EloR [uncultured Limosilactobacillus sp.]
MQIFKGKTTAAAIAAAEQELHISREMMKVTIRQEPRHGFLGIGRREAIIEVTVNKPAKRKKADQQPRDTQQPAKNVVKQQPTKTKQVQKAPVDPAEAARRQAAANHRKNLAKMKEAAGKCCTYLVDSLSALGVTVTATPTTIRAHQLTIELKSDTPAKVIGYHGKRINALEELSSAFLDYHGVHDPHLTLDINNYRQRRSQTIERLAADCVTEVIATGQAVFLDPMPARERKQLHQLLENNKQVKTYSHGREPFRSVVVAPAE